MGITLEDAFNKSMRMYWLKTDEYDSLTSNKNRKYNKKYFDTMETEMLPSKDKSNKALEKVK